MEKIYNKLVRDSIPSIIEADGEIPITRVLSDTEYRLELNKKLIEESNEAINSKTQEELLKELADVYEVIVALASLEDKSIEDIVKLAKDKAQKRGGFKKKIFLEKTISTK